MPYACRAPAGAPAAFGQDDGRVPVTGAESPMNIDSARLRELRTARQWSQEQLAQLSGLNLRTV